MQRALVGGMIAGWWLGTATPTTAQPDPVPVPITPAESTLRHTGQCPIELDRLMPLLLRDLPSYANRVIQRSRRRDRPADISGYILLSSPADIDATPFTLSDTPFPVASPAASTVEQIFFTTLERQYGISGFAQLQAHHRLFLTFTERAGWQIVLMQTSWQAYPGETPPHPPRDNTHGVIAQAIDLWLRDCRAGAVDLTATIAAPIALETTTESHAALRSPRSDANLD